MSIRTHVGREGSRGRFNGPEDVRTVKLLLSAVYPTARISVNTTMDGGTIDAIMLFQREAVRLATPDGIVSPNGRTWRALLTATSDSRYAMLTEQCVVKPQYNLMKTAYDSYRADSAPCKKGAVNQCAVRMSVALVRCGLDFQAFPDPARVHNGWRSCRNSIPHVMGANELARYLQTLIGSPRVFTTAQRAEAESRIRGSKGIIYFDNCFRRNGQTAKRGDHIDLWTGQKYYNQIIKVGAGGDAGVNAELFEKSDGGIWFWPLE